MCSIDMIYKIANAILTIIVNTSEFHLETNKFYLTQSHTQTNHQNRLNSTLKIEITISFPLKNISQSKIN